MDASVSTDCPRAVTTTEDSPSVDRHAGAVEGIEASVGELRRQFEDLPVAEILVSCQALLTVIEQQLDGDEMGAEESRRLVVASGWVWALLACAHFNAGQFWRAESCRQALRETAAQVGHGELAAWAWEMCSRFALADRRFQLALAAAEAGQAFAHGGPVAAWLALSAAKAAARLDDRTAATGALDRARQVFEQMPQPPDGEDCFGIDEARLASHTATVLLWLGQTEPAEDHAWQALTRLVDPDGHTKYPIRAAEARLTLGLLAGAGDLHAALCAAGPPAVLLRPASSPWRCPTSPAGTVSTGQAWWATMTVEPTPGTAAHPYLVRLGDPHQPRLTLSRSPTHRYCNGCGTRLPGAAHGAVCDPCRRRAAQLLAGAPHVPAQFWTIDQIHDALARWHMGQIIAAYRHHPHHGRPLSQELVGGWVGLTQAQISRIENSPPITDLDKLTRWALTLRIPAQLLWFNLPQHSRF